MRCETSERIPAIFHFVFGLKPQKKAFPLLNYLCLRSCVEVNRPEKVYLYYRHEPHGHYWDLIKSELTLVPVDPVPVVARYAYRDNAVSYYRYAHHADFIRVEKLLQRGGVYADMDSIFVNPLPDRLFEKPFVLGREQDVYSERAGKTLPSLCNAFIMSRRNSEFGWLWLKRMESEFDGSWSGHSGFLPQRLSEEHPEWIHVEPVRSFFKHVCTPEGIRALFEECDTDFEGVYSMHLWHHMWASWWRRDFCTFHEGQLTEQFIRDVDTTYNVVARRFLAADDGRRTVVTIGGKRNKTSLPRYRRAEFGDTLLTRAGLFVVSRGCLLEGLRMRFGRMCRRWRFRHFEVQNDFERHCVMSGISFTNEHGAPDQAFLPSDVIVDVGARMGVFAYLCHLQGSRSIHCFEPEVQSYRLLEKNVGHFDGVNLLQEAVWRSDREDNAELVLSETQGDSREGRSVLAEGRVVEFDTQWVHEEPCADAHSVVSVALDVVLRPFDHVKLLKLDCGGSEFPILLGSGLLDKVERIVGEYHETTAEQMPRLDHRARMEGYLEYRRETLVNALVERGFSVTSCAWGPHRGWFHARSVRGLSA